MKIAILLPYKENYTKSIAGAASIMVSDFNKYSIFKKNTKIYGNLHSDRKPLTRNFVNIPIETKLFSKTSEYTNSFIKNIENNIPEIIEVHNRPESIHIIIKKKISSKLILFFHNDPLELTGSKTIIERYSLLKSCYKIIFVSRWVKKQFFKNLSIKDKNNCEIIYPGHKLVSSFPKKEKIIIFSGKLNKSKGFDLFSESIIPILNKYNDWKAIVIGSEPREKIQINHKNVTFLGWLSFDKTFEYYKKSSIAIVPSKWEEPFGRTAMETAACGCVTIISDRGGLKETFNVQKELIIKNLTSKYLINLITKCINRNHYLKKIQLQNFKNQLHNIKDKVSELDKIRSRAKYGINYFSSKFSKILHIGNFNEKNSHRLFNISIANKISSGLIRNDLDVLNFDYRNYNEILKSVDDKIMDIINNYNPNLVLFGHNNIMSRSKLEIIKKKNIKTALWFEDALNEKGPDYKNSLELIEKNNDLIDNYFVTTCPSVIKTEISKIKLSFIPIPADKNIENLEIYNYKNKYKDIFFGMSHGVNYGKLKKNTYDDREDFINTLIELNPDLSYEFLGVNKEEPKWGVDFYNSLSKCKMALNLSRGKPVKYYSSNRIASYAANGIATLIDENTRYRDFFNDNEMIFYKNIKNLSNIINSLKYDEVKINKIGRLGKKRYHEIFNNYLVANFIVNKVFSKKINKKIIWDK